METGKRLIVLRGLPGSGKSTWAEESGYRVVSRDKIRESVGIGVGEGAKSALTWEEEQVVDVIEECLVRELLGLDAVVVVDATHLRRKYCVRWMKFAREEGVDIEFKKFEENVDVCVKRDKSRGEKRVGEEVIRDMAHRYLERGRIRDFKMNEEDKVRGGRVKKYTGTWSAPDCVIVDIDGTVALNESGRGWYDWKRVGEDKRNEGVCLIVEALIRDQGLEVVFASGRSEECREETEEWIEREIGLDRERIELYMRPVERRWDKDAEVKYDMFWEKIAPNRNVVAVLDDRNAVVSMWREMGLTCLQVAEGDF